MMGKRRAKRDREIPEEVAEVVEEARAPKNRLAVLEAIAANDFAKEGLPTEQGTYQYMESQGAWSGPVGLVKLVKALGYADFSPEYYGAWIITYLAAVRRLRELGQIDAAINAAIELGAALAEDEFHEGWAEGQRAWKAQQKAVDRAWGSKSERLAKKDGLRALYEQAIKNGAKTDAEAYEIAAKKARAVASTWRDGRVTARTVRRAVTGN
jgi:hypothetical protein